MLLTFLLAGCATTTATVGTNSAACSVWPSIRWSVKDTDQTIVQVKQNNARRGSFCAK